MYISGFFGDISSKRGSLGAYQCFMHSLDASVRLWPDQRTLWWRSLLGLGGPVGLEEMPQITTVAPHSKTFNKFEAGWMNYDRSLEEQEVHWNRWRSLFCLECGLDMIASCHASNAFCYAGILEIDSSKFYCVQSRRIFLKIGRSWFYCWYYILAFWSWSYDDMKWTRPAAVVEQYR